MIIGAALIIVSRDLLFKTSARVFDRRRSVLIENEHLGLMARSIEADQVSG
jgi:hypothetical protein